MGCSNQEGNCSGFGINTNSCANFVPGGGQGVTQEFTEYPQYQIRDGNYSIPGREANAVMYPSITIDADRFSSGTIPASGANCGKFSKTGICDATATTFYDYYPSELSFDLQLSDTWISYLYDTSNDAGVVGTPCYYLETETRGSSSTATGGTNPPGGTTTTGQDSSTRCIPCTNFFCTTNSTNLQYEAGENLTGDSDCPHPTLFGFGTSSNKLAFKYVALSNTLPDGVTNFSASYDGVTYTDIWDNGALEGTAYDTSQNPWQTGDESFADFEIFELQSPPNSDGFSIKFSIAPIFDDSGASTVFSGTRWTITELLAPGSGYSVNDTFALSYLHTHPDNSQTTLTLNIKITGVGPVETVAGQSGFDKLRAGDTINGHSVTRTFHTDIDNFEYHVIYLDGNGSDFTKDTNYTSNRNHVITAKAGYGIKDRAILIGMYEFLGKSIQFVTADIDKNAPDLYDTIKQPNVSVTVSNGRVTGLTIVDGGEGWNTLGKTPDLEITVPLVSSGKKAEVEGTFTAGVLTSVEIVEPGSGYSDDSPPNVFVRNVFNQETTTITDGNYNPEFGDDVVDTLKYFPKGEGSWTQKDLDDAREIAESIQEEYIDQRDLIPFEVKKDPERNRVLQLPQSLYGSDETEPLRDKFKHKYDNKHLENSVLATPFASYMEEEKNRLNAAGDKLIDDITQKQIPEFKTEKEVLVETVQGSLSNLPHASQYTKYFLRQYKPDPRISTNIKITLTCSPENEGCGHFTCNTPTLSTGGSTSTSETDPQTGVTTQTTVTTSYAMSSLLGDGCKSWSISGNMKIFNDLTRAAENVALATSKYGNPYDE